MYEANLTNDKDNDEKTYFVLCENLLKKDYSYTRLRPATLLKKRPWQRCFPANFTKFLRTPFLTEHLWWQLLFLHTDLKVTKRSGNACLIAAIRLQ